MMHFQKKISTFLLTITLLLNIVQHTETVAAKNITVAKISQTLPDLGDELYEQGREYYRVGNFQKALDFWLQALTTYRQSQKLTYLSRTLSNICFAYGNLSDYKQAIRYCKEALVIARQDNNSDMESLALYAIGSAYSGLGNLTDAAKFYEQSLAISRGVSDRRTESKTLKALADLYNSQSKYAKAIEVLQQSLAIAQDKTSPDLKEQGRVWLTLGAVYEKLGDRKQAIIYYQESLRVTKQIGEQLGKHSSDEALALLSLANIVDNTEQATNYRNQGLAIARENGNKDLELTFLYSLGKVDPEKYTLFFQDLGSRDDLAFGIRSQGLKCENQNNYTCALKFYHQSFIISQEIGNREAQSEALSSIGQVLKKQSQIELAILFFKQSINVTEAIRKDLNVLSRNLQESYTIKVSNTYRELADLLLKQDRILEAQQVLDLLKVQEISDYLRSETIGENAKKADYQPSEQNIIALSNELAELQKLDREGNLDPQQQPRLAFLTNNEKEYNQQFNAFLQTPAVQKEIQELRRTQSAQNVDIEKYNRLRGNLGKLQNAALFYPLVLDDRLELILIIANAPPIRKTVNLKRTDLNQAIATFLSNLRNPNSEVKPDAQKFYNWLIQPFEQELQQANIETIIYAPDEGLRYIPLAALYDDKQWLVERYRINNITAASLTDFTPHPASSIRVLAAASTAKHDVKIGDRTLSFSALPATKIEVDNIAAKINTTELIDRDFTESALTGKLNTHNIIHLATHGHFEVGQPEQSFILLGDGKISTIRDIGSWTLTNVSLVVLSACETAIGGQGGKGKGIEIFGLGYQIHNAGASAAIATLWKVSDGGTERLMDAFYTAVKTGNVSNVEALRQAQVAMITGNYEGLGEARSMVSVEERPRTTSTVPAKISHPYYWAAFILIGNGF